MNGANMGKFTGDAREFRRNVGHFRMPPCYVIITMLNLFFKLVGCILKLTCKCLFLTSDLAIKIANNIFKFLRFLQYVCI